LLCPLAARAARPRVLCAGRLVHPNLTFGDWWSARVLRRYERRSQCVDEFYASFAERGDAPPNDQSAIAGAHSSAIADLAGLHAAHTALHAAFVAAAASRPHLLEKAAHSDARRYSGERGVQGGVMQVFFRSWAQTWCHVGHESTAVAGALPAHLRVNAALAQFRPFAEAFGCSASSPLNPAYGRCDMW
jgi:predicted metalloendopeptidase